MYRDGRGVGADRARSAHWFRRAAEQGYAKAQNKLAIIFAKGRGVERDDVEALKWALLAARHGHGEAKANKAELSARPERRANRRGDTARGGLSADRRRAGALSMALRVSCLVTLLALAACSTVIKGSSQQISVRTPGADGAPVLCHDGRRR